MEIRHEQAGDETAIDRVNDAAFGGTDESRIVNAVRAAGLATISLVAVQDSKVVAHILFTAVCLDAARSAARALGLGPMAVVPEMQRRGIGTRLVRAGLEECARAGYHAVVVVGHPEFYPRFGFRPAREFGLRCEFDVPDAAFMAAELTPGALAGAAGTVRYAPEFGG
jgi:putative acetyltransferase